MPTLLVLLTAISLTACAPRISGDTGCTWTRTFTLTPQQVEASTEGPPDKRTIQPIWRSHYEELNAHNKARSEQCN